MSEIAISTDFFQNSNSFSSKTTNYIPSVGAIYNALFKNCKYWLVFSMFKTTSSASFINIPDEVADCRRLPPVTAYSTPLITMDKTRAHRDMLCPYLKAKLTKLSLPIRWINFLPPHFIKYDTYLYNNIYIYTILRIFIYLYTYFITEQNPYKYQTSLYHERTDINKCSTCSNNLQSYT